MARKSDEAELVLCQAENAVFRLADALRNLELIALRAQQINRRVAGVEDLVDPINEEVSRARISVAVAIDALQNAHTHLAGKDRVDHWARLFGDAVLLDGQGSKNGQEDQ